MSVGILDLTYGNSFKPGLTAQPIPINQTSFLSGITFNSGNTSFQFAATGNYQCTVNVDSDFGADAGSRIVIEAYNATTGVILDSFSIDGNSGDASWILAFSVTDISHQFQIRAITFTTLPGTIKAVRIVACDLGGGGSGGAPADGPFVTYAVDADLTNARVLTAGTDITLDVTTPGQIIVNATGGGFITAVQLPLRVGAVAPDTLSLGTAQGPTTADATSSVTWSPSANNSKGLVLQGLASQSVPMLQVQTSTGAICFNVPVPTGTLTGANNNLIGIGAGDGLTSGARNFIAGNDAGGSNSSGAMSDTVMIGHNAGLLNTANENIFIGSLTGDANTSATGQVYIGYNAGTANNGNSNVAIGHTAMTTATTATGVVAVGFDAMGACAAGVNQFVAVGYQAGRASSGANSTAIGYRCMDLGLGGSNTTSIGAFAGQDNEGDQNVYVGTLAGSNQTSGTSNVIIGYSAIGTGSGAFGGNVAIGWAAGNVNTASNNVFIGYACGDANTSGTGQCFAGYNAGTNTTGANNTIYGFQAGDGFTTGQRNTLLGANAGGSASATSMSDTVCIGNSAGLVNTGSENVFIGSLSGASGPTSATGLTFIGYGSGNAVTGSNNTVIGHNAAISVLTTGSSNIIIGKDADVDFASTSNSFVAGSSTASINNVYFGKGITNSTATAYTINGTGGSGTNNAGANLQLAGGKGTGTSEPGLVVLKYPLKTSTGTTLQSLSTQSYPVSTTMFTANLSDVTVSAAVVDTTETTLIGVLTAGSVSLEGGLLRVGRSIRVTIDGSILTSVTPPTIRLRVKIGSVAIIDTTAITPVANLNNNLIRLDGIVNTRTIGVSGTTTTTSTWDYYAPTTNLRTALVQSATGATLDTTSTANVDVTVQYGGNTAGNSILVRNIVFEILN